MDRRKDHKTALVIDSILEITAESDVEETTLALIDCGIEQSIIVRLVKMPEMRRKAYQHDNHPIERLQ